MTWAICGTKELEGAILDSVEYNGDIECHKGKQQYRTRTGKDWGYCYCYGYGGDNERCTCEPMITVVAERFDK